MARQDITGREEGGKVEKLPQEGYKRQPMSNREKARKSENDVAINKMIAFFYSGFLNLAEYKCGDYNLNKDPEMLLKEVLIEAESCGTFNRLRSTVDEYRNLIASLLCGKVKRIAYDQMKQKNTEELESTEWALFPLDELKEIDYTEDFIEKTLFVYSERKEDGCIFLKAGVSEIGVIILYVFKIRNTEEYLASNAVKETGIDKMLLCGLYAVSLHEEFEKAFSGINVYSSINRNNLDTRILLMSGWIKKYILFPERRDWDTEQFVQKLPSCTKYNPNACMEALVLTNLAEHIKDQNIIEGGQA